MALPFISRDPAIICYGSPGPGEKAAGILAARIRKRSRIEADLVLGTEPLRAGADLVFVIGTPGDLPPELAVEISPGLPRLPETDELHPECFAVATTTLGGQNTVLICGCDGRGTIYGVGHVLRAMTFLEGRIEVPQVMASERPAFWMRGGNPSGPGSRARQFGQLRPQTADERREVMEDLMLLGTNIFGGDPGRVRPYGMMSSSGRTANEMPPGFPAEWGADGGTSKKYVCPSIPEARKALLGSFEEMFASSKVYDFFTTNSGDVGGCRCERCMPWGGTYIRLVHEIADILHRYQPGRKVLATNQDLTSEGNQAILDYLNSTDPSWLHAIRYGPGADEMQTYIRGPVNPGWFIYEGFGPLGNYLRGLHHQLPRETGIALYSDITHWMQSQFGVQQPDIALAAVYQRRSWNARPRYLTRVAREILHYAMGDMHYSEGMHDDFNKWLWYRLLWNPHLTAGEITREYCRYWFGPEAEDDMAEAIFLMEENLEKPVLGNDGIPRVIDLIRSAWKRVPPNLRAVDYRWRIIAQKALMDLYIQLLLERGKELKEEAAGILEGASRSADPEEVARAAMDVLEGELVTVEMGEILQEARSLGEESNSAIGYRVPAPFIVGEMDLTEVGWWRKVLGEAIQNGEGESVRNAAAMILGYEDPGEGGIYVNLGWPGTSRYLVSGDELWGFMPFKGPARMSHYGVAYSFGRAGERVSMLFEDLEPGADYVLRLSVGVHMEESELPVEGVRLQEGLEVNGRTLSEGFPVTVGDMSYHEFDVAGDLNPDGRLEVVLVPGSEVLPVTGLSEIWVMRRENVPWRAP